MPSSKKRVTGYIGPELETDWAAYVEHLGISESAALEWAIRAEIRRFRGENSKERMLEHLSESMGHQMRKTDMLLLLAWQAAAGGGEVKVTADDVRKLRELLDEITL